MIIVILRNDLVGFHLIYSNERKIYMSNEINKRNTVLMIFAIFVISINMRPAITSIGPMLETIREQLSLSNAQVSLLTAVPVICMGIFAM